MNKRRKNTSGFAAKFDAFATKITHITGSSWAFLVALMIIIIWGITGPIFQYSDTWQLVINTGTTIVTFLMVFVIQQSQNKDTLAVHLKLNELIAANEKASNRLIDVEDLTEEELEILKKYYITLSNISKREKELRKSHSIEDIQTKKVESTIKEGLKKKG
ncbi:low affinity iron permease family protein [Arachidicoccus sp.]|uniref:low affinity iron permease family protein n=1 Tax=Arachidicoccus sp. TaxID=1872624 RepID=UPI003D1FAD6F